MKNYPIKVLEKLAIQVLANNRTQIRAELDAYYARLYGLTRDELRYILDPKEVHGEDFPSETFPVLKEKEVRLYGDASQSDEKIGVGGVG